MFENESEFGDANFTTGLLQSDLDPSLVFGPKRDTLFIVIPVTIIYCLIFIIGLFGNILTCFVVVKNKFMHTATNYYLFSLAMSDLLLLVSGMPQEIYYIWSKWPYAFGSVFCWSRGLAAETSTNASVITITIFTIERYVAICHPFHSHKVSKPSRATKHILGLWVVAFIMALPQALQFGLTTYKGVVVCSQIRVIIKHSFEISTFVFFFAPMVLITVLYTLIGIKLKANISGKFLKRQISANDVEKVNRKINESTKKIVKMLVAVVVAFFICWAPFHAQRLVAIYGTATNNMAKSQNLLFVYSILTYISGVFYYMSTCINPILYHIMSSKFRDAFRNTILKCCMVKRHKHKKNVSHPSWFFARVPTLSGTENISTIKRNTFEVIKFKKVQPKENRIEIIEDNSEADVNENISSANIKNPLQNNETIINELSKTNKDSVSTDRKMEKTRNKDKEQITLPSPISNSSLKDYNKEDLKIELLSYIVHVKEKFKKIDSNNEKGLDSAEIQPKIETETI